MFPYMYMHAHTLSFIQTFRIYICTCITSVYTLYVLQIWFIYAINKQKQASLNQTDFTHFLSRKWEAYHIDFENVHTTY